MKVDPPRVETNRTSDLSGVSDEALPRGNVGARVALSSVKALERQVPARQV